jgi:hypothetical protein
MEEIYGRVILPPERPFLESLRHRSPGDLSLDMPQPQIHILATVLFGEVPYLLEHIDKEGSNHVGGNKKKECRDLL